MTKKSTVIMFGMLHFVSFFKLAACCNVVCGTEMSKLES